MIRVGALDGGAVRSCCSNEERTASETSQTSVSVSMVVPAGEETDHDAIWPSACEETGSPKKVTNKTRRAGIDDEDQLEFEDMESTSEEWDDGPAERMEAASTKMKPHIVRSIVDALKMSSVFHSLEDSQLHEVASTMRREVYKDKEVIIRQGDMPEDTDCMYYLASGEVHLHISGTQSEKQQVIPKKSGWVFGDVAILFGSPRTASIVASGKCTLYALNRLDFVTLMKHVPKIRMLRFLRKLPFLKSVSDNKLITFGREAQLQTCEKDTQMIVRNEMFYIIRRGRVRVEESTDQGSHVLTRGNFFNVEETRSYHAMNDVELIMVQQSTYQQLGGAELYLQIVEEAVMQILTVIGNIDVEMLDIADIVRRNPLISAGKGEVILGMDQPIDHLYVIVKGEVEAQTPSNSDFNELKVKRHNGAQFFGDKWNRKILCSAEVIVTSGRVQLLKISHRVLSIAGIRRTMKARKSIGHQLSRRVVDALPLTYEEPKIPFKDLNQHRVVGEGEYGAVRFVTHRSTGEQFALKIMHKAAIKDTKTAEHVIMERKMLVRLDGNNFLVGLRGAYQDERSIYLLMDWVPGGELFSRIIDCGGKLPDHHAVFYAANVVLAYSIMHKLDIIYRDLKPENMLIDRNGYLKLADYGFATVSDGSAWTVCGTPDYQAPEIITRQGASKASDFWALGVLIYEMLTGDAPFKSPSNDRWDIHRRILSGRFYVPDYISQHAADLITQLLQVDPEKRLGYRETDLEKVKSHPWFKNVDWDKLSKQAVSAPFIPKLVNSTDTSCFDQYDTPMKMDAPSVRHNFFGKECPWSCLWSWIDEF